MPNSFDQSVGSGVVDSARGGSREAHAALYAAFAPPVYTLAWRLTGRRDTAEEILQETFVEVIKSIAGYRGDGTIGPWIRRIAVSKCMMHFRSAWQRLRDDLAPGDFDQLYAAVDANPHARIEVEELLVTLPPPTRAVVWLHDVEGYTHKEIGALMGKTASFSKSQLTRAYAALRRAFAPESEPAAGADQAAQPQEAAAGTGKASLDKSLRFYQC